MSLTLNLPPETERKLSERASQAGESPEKIALKLLEDALSNNVTPITLDTMFAPVHEEFERSGMSEGELAEFLTTVREKAFQDRQTRKVP